MIVEYIQSALLLIAAFLVIVSAVGFISLSKDMKNVVYGRIHIVGIFDIAGLTVFPMQFSTERLCT